jgi:hypothetical protein
MVGITNPQWNSGPGLTQTQSANLQFTHNAAAVTPNNSVDLANPGYIAVGVAGNLNVDTINGDTVVVPAAAGIPVPVLVKRVRATSTTATGIVVYY